MKKTYIIREGKTPFSDVVNDCETGFCFPINNGDTLSQVLKKLCAYIKKLIKVNNEAGSFGWVFKESPLGEIDSINTHFTLDFIPLKGSEHVFVNGILMEEGSDYIIIGRVIIFLEGAIPQETDKLKVTYYKA